MVARASGLLDRIEIKLNASLYGGSRVRASTLDTGIVISGSPESESMFADMKRTGLDGAASSEDRFLFNLGDLGCWGECDECLRCD